MQLGANGPTVGPTFTAQLPGASRYCRLYAPEAPVAVGRETGVPPRPRPLILGHRGARTQAPENTLPAFRRALQAGADGVELDVRLTGDGHVVVLHDATLARTTDGQGRVHRHTLAQLRRLDAGSWFGPDFSGTRLCTLQEALDLLAGATLVNVELKGSLWAGPGLEGAVSKIVRAREMLGQVLVSSFSTADLWRLRRVDDAIALGWLHGPGPAGWLRLLWARLLHLQALHPFHSTVSEAYVGRAHRRGLRVFVWTINKESQAKQLAAWGVNGLITDRPEEMRHWLLQAGYRESPRRKPVPNKCWDGFLAFSRAGQEGRRIGTT